MKKHWLFTTLLAIAFCVLCLTLFPAEAKAASVSDLTFTLNSDGESYAVTDCSTSASGELIIPATYNEKPVTRIGSSAFYNCSGLSSITIPDSVTSIGSSAFYGCSSLENMTIPFVGDSRKTASDTYQYPFGYIFGTSSYTGAVETRQYYYKASTSSRSFSIYYIPSSLKSVTITGGNLLYGAFYSCSGLTSVIVGDNVTSIHSDVFWGCYNLQSITVPFWPGCFTNYFEDTDLPDSIRSVTVTGGDIQNRAFENLGRLTSITIGDGVTSIGERAFYGCTGLTSLSIPDSVSSIGEDAFIGCYNLPYNIYDNATYLGNATNPYCVLVDTVSEDITNCEIYENTKLIHNNAFYNCSGLTSIVVPDSVVSIGEAAFSGCSGLESITLPLAGNSFTGIFGTNWYDGSIAITHPALDTYYIPYRLKTVIVNGGSISWTEFYNCSNLTNITICDGVTSIGDTAFYNCSSLTNITIPDSVTSIGYGAFFGCSSLETMTIPFVGESRKTSSDTYQYPFGYIFGIYSYTGSEKTTQYYYGSSTSDTTYDAYYIPSSLKSVTVTSGNILYGAFYNCSGLSSVTIGDGVTSIGDYAFYNCSSLTSITTPDRVTSIGNSAFRGCSRLTSITIPDSVTSIGNYAFYGCKGLTSITIPDSVTSIGDSAFFGCSSLTSITIPDSITSIGSSAFRGCSRLTSITIPDSVTSIGNYAFYGCSSLTSITIPDSITSIGNSAFDDCSNLTSITIPDSVTSIGDYAFRGCSSLTGILVSVNNSNYSSDTNGILFNKDHTILIFAPCKISGNYTIPNTVTGIDCSAFDDCSNLTSITIPDSVTSIGDDAFSGCSGLTSITIPNSVTSIGNYAFYGCSSLTEITIPDSVTSIGSSAFRGCSGLTEITIPDSVTSIGGSAFYGCSNLKSMTIPFVGGSRKTASDTYQYPFGYIFGIYSYTGSVKTTQYYYGSSTSDTTYDAYYIPSSLKSVTVTSGNILYGAFYNCSSLTSVTIGDGVTSIGDKAFYNCSGLTEIEISSSVTSIGDKAFYNCIGLTDIWYTGSVHDKNNISIGSSNEVVDTATWHYLCCTENHSYSLNGGYTCDMCMYSRTPSAPVIENRTNNSVTLIPTDGFEYSKDGINWQSSNVFTDLAADATYTFYQRVAASEIALVSEASQGTSVTFKPAQAAPSAPIILSYTDTTVTLFEIANGEYSTDGITWQTNNVFTGLSAAINYAFYQRYAETVAYEASNSSLGVSITTDKAKQTSIPNAPMIESFTSSTITLVAVDGCEYSKNGTTWQSSNVFSGLSCATEYTFYQRYQETTTTYAGKSSEGLIAKTDKGVQSQPAAPTLSSKTYNSVTLYAISGYEYSRDGINWQKSNEFTGLDAETNYLFFQRIAETDTHYASDTSAMLAVRTDEVPACVTDPALHSYTSTCDTTCNACGATRSITHTWDNACDTSCNICDETRSTTHTWDNACDTSCNICGETRSTTHTWDNACDASCNICGETRSTAHTWDNACDASCNICGETRSTTHTWDNACDTLCNTCGASRVITHNYVMVTTKATLAENGTMVDTCDICGATGAITTIPCVNTFRLPGHIMIADGTLKKPVPIVMDAQENTLIEGVDYIVTYPSNAIEAGDYELFVTLIGNYSGEKILHFVIEPAIEITKQPTTQKVKAGATVELSLDTIGFGVEYQWQSSTNGTSWKNCSSSSATKATFSFTSKTSHNGNYYRCKITDGAGNVVYTSAVRLYVLGVTTQPKTQTVKSGATVKFTVKATGTGLKYQWQSSTNGKTWKNCSSSSATKATFSFTSKTSHNGNYYRCKVTDSAGNVVYTSSVRAYVLGVTTQPKTQKVESGETVKFTVKATGTGLKYQWQVSTDGKTWKNCTSSSAKKATFTFTSKNSHSSNYYRCRIKDNAGNTVYTDAVRLYVLGITTQPTAKTVKAGATAKFTVKATGAGKTYQWQVSTDGGKTWTNCSSSSAKKATFTFTSKTSHNGNYYRCRVKDNGGNTVYTAKVKLTVKK